MNQNLNKESRKERGRPHVIESPLHNGLLEHCTVGAVRTRDDLRRAIHTTNAGTTVRLTELAVLENHRAEVRCVAVLDTELSAGESEAGFDADEAGCLGSIELTFDEDDVDASGSSAGGELAINGGIDARCFDELAWTSSVNIST